jgi:hypothetical protein
MGRARRPETGTARLTTQAAQNGYDLARSVATPKIRRAHHECGADRLCSASILDQRGTNDSGPP